MEPQNTINLSELNVETFLLRNRITSEDWEKAKIDFSDLLAIGIDHNDQAEQLADTAVLFAKIIQKFEGVHSVRWRIKNPEHLMGKIVRKRAKGEPKYADINKSNYFTIVTDLIGIRALHLFKEDCFIIDRPMRGTWQLEEEPIAYLRDGDQSPITDRLRECKFEIKNHPAGYRSIHYVFSSQPVGRRVITEVQVRTIFEEGWSEIDHNVRYPNFSDNQLVAFFLAIFNRMAGSADEMGAFVRGLIQTLERNEKDLIEAGEEKGKILGEMSKALQELDGLKEQDAQSQTLIAELQSKVKKLNQSEGALSRAVDYEQILRAVSSGKTLSETMKNISALADLRSQANLGMVAARDAQEALNPQLGLLRPPRKNP
ncbi:hypothetical protein [Variovorax sp. YR566]|uniref:hypothetical protein n=1 Tax=Variovorax sp. YR566 TaxID=3450237 RepID=UPI003F7ED6AD